MNRQKIVDIIGEDATSIEVMTQCLNQFHKHDLECASDDERQCLMMAVKRFASLIKGNPYPKRI